MKEATMVALDKLTGSLVWAAPVGDPAAHASVVKFTSGGVEQYVTVTGKGSSPAGQRREVSSGDAIILPSTA